MPGSILDVDIDKPKWDQTTFMGRLKHFATITDVRKVFLSEKQLQDAKILVGKHRAKLTPAGTTEEELWKAKHIYDSAFHPDSGSQMNLGGRMSFQVPGGMSVTALMLQFYQTPLGVGVTQWMNQSFNALVNFTNRNAATSADPKDMLKSYLTATSTALVVALSLNFYARKAPSIVARCVPFAAVASANSVNIPFSRQDELKNGVPVYSKEGEKLGSSKKCAQKGIGQVVFSRVVMAAPGMLCVPIMMERMTKKSAWFRKKTWTHLPFQTVAVGCFLLFMVPIACALFPQQASMKVEDLEPDLKDSVGSQVNRVYFNKGL